VAITLDEAARAERPGDRARRVTVSPEGVDPTVHSFAHDFVERPILVLGPEQIGMA